MSKALIFGAGRRCHRATAFVALATAGVACDPATAITIANNGKTAYRIVIPATAIPAERYAAEELQRYLAKISGAILPIVTDDQKQGSAEILLGRNRHLAQIDFDSLGPDGFMVHTDGEHLVIAGGRPRGTLNGVYAFLEENLGVRWFTPDLEVVPHSRQIQLREINQRRLPAFENRDSDWTELTRNPDFAARLRLNGQHVGLQEKHGGPFALCYPFVHSFEDLVPQSLCRDHPEYFPLIDGRRKTGYVQRCLTNPDVLRISIDRVRQWIKEHPEATIISVSQNDSGDYCQCDRCKAIDDAEGSPAGSLLKFVNAIAEAIEPEYPKIKIDTLAYTYSRKPPRTIRPRHNVIVRLCSFECCFGHPIATCLSEDDRRFREDLAGWRRIAPSLSIWDYTTNFTNYQQPFPNFHSLQPNLQFYAKNGIKNAFAEGNDTVGSHGEMEPLRTYLLAKLMWDPDGDVAQHTREFVNAYYGRAGSKILSYLDIIEGPMREQNEHARIFDLSIAHYLDADTMDAAERVLNEAEKSADNRIIRFRVQVARLPVWYVKIANNRIAGEARKRLLRRFLDVARRAGISDITGSMSLAEWAKFEKDIQ
jgi:hypothetical protein